MAPDVFIRKPSDKGNSSAKANRNVPCSQSALVKGEELAIRDFRSSDPYVILTLGNHICRTRTMKNNLNPDWNEDFRFPVENTNDCLLKVLGDATMDLKALVEEKIKDRKVVCPCKENCLYRDSSIKRVKEKVVQEACLKLRNVESGVLTLRFEWPA